MNASLEHQVNTNKQTRVLRFSEVVRLIGLSRSQIRRLELAGKFPGKIRLGPHSVGYLAHEIEAYLIDLAGRRTNG